MRSCFMLQRATYLSDLMKLEDLVPNVITYDSLISACEKGKHLQRAIELFILMKQEYEAQCNYLQRFDQCVRKGHTTISSREAP